MKIVWSPTAQNRVREILDYIAIDDPVVALSFIEIIEAKVDKLLQNPGSGRPISEIQGSSIRELIVHKNYSVIYEIRELKFSQYGISNKTLGFKFYSLVELFFTK